MQNAKYRTLEDYDAFICNVGRVQVPKGAEYEIQHGYYYDRVYFLNTKNYLPCDAVSTFLKTKREPLN